MSKDINNRFERIAKHLAEQPLSDMENTVISIQDKQALEALSKTWNTINKMQEIEQFDTDKAWNKLMGRLTGDELVKPFIEKPAKKIKTSWVYSIAASLVLLLGIVGFLITQNNQAKMVFTNNTMEPKVVFLPDGTHVSLNTNSQVVLNKGFANKNRNVAMQGEVFFKVNRNEHMPFVISVQQTQVKVLGTSFNVKSIQNKVEVVVETGKVEVYNIENNATHVFLTPGEQAIATNTGISKNLNNHENYLAWLNKKLVFKSMPLAEVIRDINTAYHSQIVIGDAQINDLLITATYKQNSIDEILKSITLAFNLKLEIEGKKHILVSDNAN
jgi:ferric-dicitrate binding protein FerR (iron transport regulator)